MNVTRLPDTYALCALNAAQVLLFSACSGGGASSTQLAAVGANSVPSVATAQPTRAATAGDTQPVQVNMSYVLPAANSTTTQSAAQRNLQYVASTNTQIMITVTPFGGSPTVFGPSSCTAVTCNLSFTATPGPNTIAFVLTDGTNTLSRFSTTTIVQSATINTLNFTANPVVNSVVLSLASPTVNGGVAANTL